MGRPRKYKHLTTHRINGRRFCDPVYARWTAMMRRCNDPNSPMYYRYGGRGIVVCERWHNFDNFYDDWCILDGEGDQLDRVDNDGNYTPENCRRVSRNQNMQNTYRRREITWNGETKHYIEWAKLLGIKPRTLAGRIFKYRWPVERAMTEGVNDYIKQGYISWEGETLHCREWAERLGISRSTLYYRVFIKKWPLERAMTEGINRA